MLRFPLLAAAGIFAAALTPHSCQIEDGPPPDRVSFYFIAHEDDWQLFMNPSAFHDVGDAETKTVFVHLTAGDAGSGTGTQHRKNPFYLARENGAQSAIRFMSDWDNRSVKKYETHVRINGHRIYRISYRDTVSYYLRLPDGNPLGSGYSNTGFQSLKRLANSEIDTLSVIDGSTVYHGWSDLVATLRGIVDFERGSARRIQLNVPELDAARNPEDHNDHLMTARAALEATKDIACAQRIHYVDYATAQLPENLDNRDRDMKSAVFAITLAGVLALDHDAAWHRYDKYMGKNYFRVEEGDGSCAPDANKSASLQK